ncbi:hypothetical protein HDV05_002661 [Chytridiales sp. JEL 0842]|nr:hypothetical protein HDV05_002661 [Chytridiales sp. JEL 0842]
MSHFTEYQVRRFRFIFNQYSEDAVTEAEIDTDPFQVPENELQNPFADRLSSSRDRRLDIDGAQNSNWKIRLSYRLTANELCSLLPRLGPAISLNQGKQFIYDYDSSCTGALDFEDFLEFLGDYQVTLQQKRDKALAHYNDQRQLAMERDPSHPSEQWFAGEPVGHPNPRVVVARHFINAYPIESAYLESLYLDDPEFFFTKQETLTNEIISSGISKPEWDQDLNLDIVIPPGEIHDIQQWVDRQVLRITLLDFNDSGTVPHSEMIASASLPLLRILISAKKPLRQVLRLNTMDCVVAESDLACIEVSIVDNTQERWAWAKTIDLWNQYSTITRALRGPFRRRMYNAFLLDEHNAICNLTSLVRPIIMHDQRISSPKEAAIAVANIPYHHGIVHVSDTTKRLISQHLSAAEEDSVASNGTSDSLSVAGWPLMHSPFMEATENFYAQVSSPQTMLIKRKGTLMEHAVLLCGLLLGMGVQAYIAIGKNSTPSSIMYPIPFHGKDARMDDKHLLNELVESIKLYRRHILFIPDTEFHREASRYLQAQLHRFESALYTSIAEKVNAFGGPEENARKLKGGLTGSFSSSVAFLKDNSMMELNANLVRQTNEGVHTMLPERHWWRGSFMHFKDIDVDSIMDQIVSTGILDACIPGVIYSVAARIFPHSFGMTSVWVGVGYMADFLNTDGQLL